MVTIKIIFDEKTGFRKSSWEIDDPLGVQKPISIKCRNNSESTLDDCFVLDFIQGDDIILSSSFSPRIEAQLRADNGYGYTESAAYVLFKLINQPAQRLCQYYRVFTSHVLVSQLIDQSANKLRRDRKIYNEFFVSLVNMISDQMKYHEESP